MNELRQQQKTLWRKKRLFQSVVDESSHLILILDPEGNIFYCNPTSKTLLGLIPDMLTGAHITDWIHETHLAEINGILDGSRKKPSSSRRIPLRFRHQNAHWQEFDVVVNSITDEAHDLIGIVFHVHAKTETQSINQQLQGIESEARLDASPEENFTSTNQCHLCQTRKLTIMGSLVGAIAHDFNNVLTALLGYGEILKSKFANHPEPELKEVVTGICEASSLALSLTQQLMSFGRKKAVGLSVLDLNRLVLNLKNLLHRMVDKPLSVRFDLHPTPILAKTNDGQIEQVLMNLIINARDAMPGGGEVRIFTEYTRIPKPFVHGNRHLPAGDYAVLAVSDTGCGMNPEVLAHIFDPFFTTKQKKGNGLGLAIVHRIAIQHRGFVDVVSEEGKGSTFRVHLPRAEEKLSCIEPVPEATARPSPPSAHTILLAEKEESLCRFLRHTLEHQGYEVLEAHDECEALDMAMLHKTFIHLLVTNIIIPAANGQSLAQKITRHHPGIRVLYISGRLAPMITRETLGTTEDFLEKPFSPKTFIEKVQELLREQELAASAQLKNRSMSAKR